MTEPAQITFRHMSGHQALSDAVQARTRWLDTFDPQVAGCRVALDFTHRHQEDAARERRAD